MSTLNRGFVGSTSRPESVSENFRFRPGNRRRVRRRLFVGHEQCPSSFTTSRFWRSRNEASFRWRSRVGLVRLNDDTSVHAGIFFTFGFAH